MDMRQVGQRHQLGLQRWDETSRGVGEGAIFRDVARKSFNPSLMLLPRGGLDGLSDEPIGKVSVVVDLGGHVDARGSCRARDELAYPGNSGFTSALRACIQEWGEAESGRRSTEHESGKWEVHVFGPLLREV